MKLQDILVAIVVAFIWGFSFVVIEVGLDSFPPLFFSALRFVFSAFPAILFIQKGTVGLRWIVPIGLVLGVLMFSLLFVGMKVGMPAGLSSLVLQIQSVFTLMLSSLLLKDVPSALQKLGISIAFGGILVLVFDSIGQSGPSLARLGFVIGAGLAWVASNILMKKAGEYQYVSPDHPDEPDSPVAAIPAVVFFRRGTDPGDCLSVYFCRSDRDSFPAGGSGQDQIVPDVGNSLSEMRRLDLSWRKYAQYTVFLRVPVYTWPISRCFVRSVRMEERTAELLICFCPGLSEYFPRFGFGQASCYELKSQ